MANTSTEELARRLAAAFISMRLRVSLAHCYNQQKDQPVGEYWLQLAQRVQRDMAEGDAESDAESVPSPADLQEELEFIVEQSKDSESLRHLLQQVVDTCRNYPLLEDANPGLVKALFHVTHAAIRYPPIRTYLDSLADFVHEHIDESNDEAEQSL
jgi:hypothetical protein